ncbi:MAG: hypothetical protein GXP62_07895 [Oligoflexia bacterium]|nr:hypothetical protein [Oligoflexia bacterium]
MILFGLLSTLLAQPTFAAQPVAEEDDAPPTEAVFQLPHLDVLVRIPLDDPETGWVPPPWALPSDSSLALEKKGTQLLAMVEQIPQPYQPTFTADGADELGQALSTEFLGDTYAGPELGEINWDPFVLVESGPLGRHIRGTAQMDLPDRPDETGRLVIDLYPVRAGLNATIIVGVSTPEEALAAADEMASYTAFYDGPVSDKDLPTDHHTEDSGYELDLPDGFRALTDRERLALNGEPVGGNSGFGGALGYQTYLDPTTLGGWRSFGCVAFSADTLEVIDPAKAPRLADNFRLMSSIMLKGGSYQVDGNNPIRGREANLLDPHAITVDPTVKGELSTIELGDRAGYLWHPHGVRSTPGQSDQPVDVATFYTAWSDVNLHCQAVAPADRAELLTQFDQAMRTLRVTNGAAHPLHLGLMARYKRWWPYTNPLAQLYWLPFPIVLFAAWLANRGD